MDEKIARAAFEEFWEEPKNPPEGFSKFLMMKNTEEVA